MIGIIILVILVALVLFFIGIYNSLVQLRNRVKNAWSQIDVQLKRRHDLIPNLVETAKGYMKHERETLENVTEARSRAMGATSVGDKGKAEGALGGAISRFMLVVENYPDLKANQNFLELQTQLEGTENRITQERRRFNLAAQSYNTRIMQFPGNIFARIFGFQEKAYFEAVEGSEAPPVVDFSG